MANQPIIDTAEAQRQYEENIKKFQIATGQDPTKHGRLPFRLFDPGKKDPWRELHLVDADNRGVTTLGPLMDTTDMTLGNALYIMECCNNHEGLVMTVGQLEAEVDRLNQENKNLVSEIHDLRMKIAEKNVEIRELNDKMDELKNEV